MSVNCVTSYECELVDAFGFSKNGGTMRLVLKAIFGDPVSMAVERIRIPNSIAEQLLDLNLAQFVSEDPEAVTTRVCACLSSFIQM